MTTKTKLEFDQYGDLLSPPTLAMARAVLAQFNMLIRKQDGEFRVAHREDDVRPPKSNATLWNRKGAHVGRTKFKRPPRLIDESMSERCAYYTNDLEDAVNTGISMRRLRTERYAARAGIEQLLSA